MDVGLLTTIATSLGTTSHARQGAEVHAVEDSGHAREVEKPNRFAHGFHGRGLALGVLRQELKFAMSGNFRSELPGYAESSGGATASEVAAETLNAAKKLVLHSSADAGSTLVSLKSRVEEAAIAAREIVGGSDDLGDVEDAVQLVNEGLDELEAEAAQTFQSSASVLAVETELRQRSTIRIRTQEGDIVKLDLRRMESFSAIDVMVNGEGGTASTTQIEVSSGSRLSFSVNGDLNEAELAAIQNIFAQAEAIADEFFAGDLGAAFDLASGLEYDTEQLARVSMRFREKQVSEVVYAAIGSVQAPPAAEIGPVVAASSEATPEVAVTPAVVVVAEPEQPVQGENTGEVPVGDSALAGLFDLVSNFLRSVAGSFEGDSGNNAINAKYVYSESFKLELLKTVMQVAAPSESEGAATLASSIIDATSETGDIPARSGG